MDTIEIALSDSEQTICKNITLKRVRKSVVVRKVGDKVCDNNVLEETVIEVINTSEKEPITNPVPDCADSSSITPNHDHQNANSKSCKKQKRRKAQKKKKKSQLKHDSDSESDDLELFLRETKPKRVRRCQKPIIKSKEEDEVLQKEDLRKRTCEKCNIVFSIPKGLLNHIRVKHTFERPFTCQECGQTFAVESSFALHRRRHLGFKPYLCSTCGKNFLRLTDMRMHMKTHNKTNEFKCDLCPNAYNTAFSLRKHKMIIHTNPSEWKHSCKICGKKCVSTTTLSVHLKKHTEDRSFTCHICGKGFFTNQNRKVHVRTHSANTLFNCKLCPKGYRSNEALQNHLVRIHNIGESKKPTKPKFFCPICKQGFIQNARMERHIRIHETGEEEFPFRCWRCRKRYKDKNFFTLHMINRHRIELDEHYFDVKEEPKDSILDTPEDLSRKSYL